MQSIQRTHFSFFPTLFHVIIKMVKLNIIYQAFLFNTNQVALVGIKCLTL